MRADSLSRDIHNLVHTVHMDMPVLHPAHTGGDGTCTRTAYDPTTATYMPCPHPDHNPEAPLVERQAAELVELRSKLAHAEQVAAIFHALARGKERR